VRPELAGQAVSDSPPTRYRFGPLERRGLVAGWRGGQIGAVAAALVVDVGVLRISPSPVGVMAAVAVLAVGVAVATWPIAGRTAEQWAPDALRHLVARQRGARAADHPLLSVDLVGVDATSASDDPVHPSTTGVGVLHDRSRRTLTAVLGASDPGFVLLGEDDKVRRVGAWSGVLASLARDGTAISRVQWLERVVPTEATGLALPPVILADDAARSSYRALVEVERGALRHEVLLAVTVHLGRARGFVKSGGGGQSARYEVLLREVASLRRRLTDASLDVGAVLSPEALSAVVRGASSGSVSHDGASAPKRWPWPMGVAAEWDRFRTDDTWHATYWISEWPRTDASPDFLGPLLLSSEVRRTVSVVMEPLGPIEASRKVEQARTADVADAELRRRGGFLATARRRREEEILARREVELADGHAQYRFSGYVTVSACATDALDDACGRVEQAAALAGLELRRCYGDQANTFLCTLPLGRGLA